MYSCIGNLEKNQAAIVTAIAAAYETGQLEDPHHASTFINILALICEDKVEGNVGEDGIHKWRLTDWYADQIDSLCGYDGVGY